MIGVIAKADHVAAAQEFFQLFKTPWEFYRPERVYDVVVATVADLPDLSEQLVVLYGVDAKTTDARLGVSPRARRQGGRITFHSVEVPVYGGLVTFQAREAATACLYAGREVAGLRFAVDNSTVLRLGYDLFDEVGHLLSAGQPPDRAHIPTLDIHVQMLRGWILAAGIPLVEIPPTPANCRFAVCLTHDIDFGGMRNHLFDHTMWGFLYRSTVGAVRNVLRGRYSLPHLLQSWRAALSLPFVFAGLAKDFWDPFEWYLTVERNLPATYFLIPFKGRPGDRVNAPHPSRRTAGYELSDLAPGITAALNAGCELAVHGIDAWHSADSGRSELKRISELNGESSIGVRVHWLLRDERTFRMLDDAGFAYDSTSGYNETVGYRSGTTQVFRPLGIRNLLELPLHIQDGALFYPDRLDLSDSDAWKRCSSLLEHAAEFGGVLTTLWHDRSPAPERFWGGFYLCLLRRLQSLGVWFASAGAVVGWFRKRREVSFERVEGLDGAVRTCIRYDGGPITPPLTIRVHRMGFAPRDLTWDGRAALEIDHASGCTGAAAAPLLVTESFRLRDAQTSL